MGVAGAPGPAAEAPGAAVRAGESELLRGVQVAPENACTVGSSC